MDITAYELAQAIRVSLIFGDEGNALKLAEKLVAHHEASVDGEYADYIAKQTKASGGVTANDLTTVTAHP